MQTARHWESDDVKMAIFTMISCVHRNINFPENPIKFIARVNTDWAHDLDTGTRYDHVMIQTSEEGRLAGCRLARLQLIGELYHGEQKQTFLCVKWYDPFEYLENIRMQSYTLSQEPAAVIPSCNLIRNVHVVPVWSTEIAEAFEGPFANPDIFHQFSQFVVNTHSDQAAWNWFY